MNKSTVDVMLNPRGIEHPVAEGVAFAAGTITVAGMLISGWLHRGVHGGIEYSENTKKVLRIINFLSTGMPLVDWWVHLTHHRYPDRYDQEAHETWNANRPEGAPEAPKEIFRDPYSVKLEGYPRVKFLTSQLHRKSKLKTVPWVFELARFDEENGIKTRLHWPDQLRNVDLEEADPTKIRNRQAILGLVAVGTVIAATRSPKTALTWTAIHVPVLLNMGGVINADAHTGQNSGFWNRVKVLTGIDEPIPDEKGEFAANILEGNEGLLFGEYHHKYHHDNPKDPYLAGGTLRRDPPGFIIRRLVKLGLATTPGAQTEPLKRAT